MKKIIISSIAAMTLLVVGAANASTEKGVERLLGNRITASDSVARAGMSCPACRTTVSAVADRNAKGGATLAKADTVKVARHLCGECKTEIGTEGVGRNALRVAKHLCGRCAN